MNEFNFSLVLSGEHEHDDVLANALFEAGCDDATPWSHGPTVSVVFARTADSLTAAMSTAVADVRRAGYDVIRAEIADEDLQA